jgi:hypothetical protein
MNLVDGDGGWHRTDGGDLSTPGSPPCVWSCTNFNQPNPRKRSLYYYTNWTGIRDATFYKDVSITRAPWFLDAMVFFHGNSLWDQHWWPPDDTATSMEWDTARWLGLQILDAAGKLIFSVTCGIQYEFQIYVLMFGMTDARNRLDLGGYNQYNPYAFQAYVQKFRHLRIESRSGSIFVTYDDKWTKQLAICDPTADALQLSRVQFRSYSNNARQTITDGFGFSKLTVGNL